VTSTGGAAQTALTIGSNKLLAQDKSPNLSLKKMCTVVEAASSQIKGQADKAAQRKAEEEVLSQWADILYIAQSESGVSINDINSADVIKIMAETQAEIEKSAPAPANDQDEMLPTGYTVNDSAGALKKGATTIPIVGAGSKMIANKTVAFEGVPGTYKLAAIYDGKSGQIKIKPGLTSVPRHGIALITNPEWTSFDIARMTLETAGIADPTGTVAVAAAYLHPVCGSEEANRSRGDYCYRHSDTRGVGVIPIACNPSLPDHQAGLCYKPCPEGYKGVGPVCWTVDKVSIPRGAGVIPVGCPTTHPVLEGGLCYQACKPVWTAKSATICYQDCPAGYRDDGLYCGKTTYGRGAGYVIWDKAKCEKEDPDVGCERKGALWYPRCKPGFEMTTVNFCQTKGCPAGFSDIGVSCKKPSEGRGVGVPRNVCAPEVSDLDAGLCYKPCPEGYKGVGPVCWTEKAVSIPRGAGLVPDQCPASHPLFDAGLCYRNCPNPAYDGIGPVCWGGCKGRYSWECGVGCATTQVSCGLVTTEMVVAPLEAVASILSLGGYSLADKAKDSAKKAFKETLDAADGPAAKAFGRTVGQRAAKSVNKSIKKLKTLSEGLAQRKNAIVKAVRENVFDPAKDKLVKAGTKVKVSTLDPLKDKVLQQRIKSGAEKLRKQVLGNTPATNLQQLEFEKAAFAKIQYEAREKARLAALKAASPGALKRAEIKEKIAKALRDSWNSTDKAWLAVGKQCTAAGINVSSDLGAFQ